MTKHSLQNLACRASDGTEIGEGGASILRGDHSLPGTIKAGERTPNGILLGGEVVGYNLYRINEGASMKPPFDHDIVDTLR